MEHVATGYELGASWDEMLETPDSPREVAVGLHDALRSSSAADLEERSAERDRSFKDRGTAFPPSGEERPLPLDVVARLVPAEEWSVVESGVAKRVRSRGLPRCRRRRDEIVADGVVARRLVVTSKHFHRQATIIDPTNGDPVGERHIDHRGALTTLLEVTVEVTRLG